MIEILFRGRTTKKCNTNHVFNSVWIEGDLITNKGKYFIHPKCNAVYIDGELGRLIIMHEVNPDTVCQYTGMTDKNGKKIFENDIIKDTGVCTGKVVFQKYEWLIHVVKSEYVLARNQCFPLWQWDESVENDSRELEVIGNIFDNPELLEGK